MNGTLKKERKTVGRTFLTEVLAGSLISRKPLCPGKGTRVQGEAVVIITAEVAAVNAAVVVVTVETTVIVVIVIGIAVVDTVAVRKSTAGWALVPWARARLRHQGVRGVPG